MTAKFKVIKPELLKYKLFQDRFWKASTQMASDIKDEFEAATNYWKTPPAFASKIKISNVGIDISVDTDNPIFKFVDEGTKPHIIKPIAPNKILHWVDRSSGDDRFATVVHHPGFSGKKITEKTQNIFNDLMIDYFEQALYEAISESGHAI